MLAPGSFHARHNAWNKLVAFGYSCTKKTASRYYCERTAAAADAKVGRQSPIMSHLHTQPGCERQATTKWTAVEDRNAPAARLKAKKQLAKSAELKGDDQLATVLQRFRKSLASRDLADSIKLYSRIRTKAIECKDADRRSQGAQQDVLRMLKLGDFRALHIFLHHSAASAHISDAATAARLYRLIVQMIDDMRYLGFRVGATEIAEYVCACNRLGQHAKAVDIWRESVSQALDERQMLDPAKRMAIVRHHYPKAHIWALRSAVALKDAELTRTVYDLAMQSMQNSRDSKTSPPKLLPAPTLALFQSFIKLAGRRSKRQINPKADDGSSSTGAQIGSDRAWDPARLGSDFLMRVYKDSQQWISHERKMLSLIVQCVIRALLLEGNAHRAIQIYKSLPTSGQRVAIMTPGILSEAVRGLCRLSQVDHAYTVLLEADERYRSIAAWNAYFHGLSNLISWRHKGYDQPGENTFSYTSSGRNHSAVPFERLQYSIRQMKELDGIEPDAATQAIWMRACFRSGQWRTAAECFRSYSQLMHSDVVCWDIMIRGLLGSADPEARSQGWKLVGQLISHTASQQLIDARIVETVLLHIFPRVNGSPSSAASALDKDTVARATTWAEHKISLDRKNTYAIIIGSLLRTGQVGGALEVHRSMRSRGFWPTRSINCMLVKSLANQIPATKEQSLPKQVPSASEFIEANLPPEHLGAAYAILLKTALRRKDYEAAWSIMDKHYPEVGSCNLTKDAAADKGSKHGRQIAASFASSLPSPFPNFTMYHTALQMTKAFGDLNEHRRVLDRMESHLDAICTSHQPASTRIALLFNHYKQNLS